MGQYFKPVLLHGTRVLHGNITVPQIVAWWDAHRYDNGLKLVEHSYKGNALVAAVMQRLHTTDKAMLISSANVPRLVWAGDYADPEPNANTTIYSLAEDSPEAEIRPAIPEPAERYAKRGSHYEYSKEYKEWRTTALPRYNSRLYYCAVNLDKQQYVHLNKQPATLDSNRQISPLPLLTAEGNGRGNGVYAGTDEDLVGAWARDRIVVVSYKSMIPKEFTELKPTFCMRHVDYKPF